MESNQLVHKKTDLQSAAPLQLRRSSKIFLHIHTNLAGPLGIEPRIAESKSVVIPFHYEPTKTWSG